MGKVTRILRVLSIHLVLISISSQGYPTGQSNSIPDNTSSTLLEETLTQGSSVSRKRRIPEPDEWPPSKQFKAQEQTSINSVKKVYEAYPVYEVPGFPLLSQEQLLDSPVIEEGEQIDTHTYPGVHPMIASDGMFLNTELSDISSQMRDIANGDIPAAILDPFKIQGSDPWTLDNRASFASDFEMAPEIWDIIVDYVVNDSVSEFSPSTAIKTKTTQNDKFDTPQSSSGPNRWPRPTQKSYTSGASGDVADEQVASSLKKWKPSQNLRKQLLSIATDTFDRNLILLLLKIRTDPKGAMVSGIPLLHFAVKAGDTELVSALLSAGADVDEAFAGTPLSQALENCDKNMIELLLKFGADVERGWINGRSAHQMAMACTNSEVIEFLLSQAKSGRLMGYVPASLSDQSRGNELSQLHPNDDTVARDAMRQISPNNANLSGWERESFLQTQDSGAQTSHMRRRKTVESAVKPTGSRQPLTWRSGLETKRAARRNKTTNSSRKSSETTRDVVDTSVEDQLILKASTGNWEAVEELLLTISISHLTRKCWIRLMDAAVDANQAHILNILATSGHSLKRSFGRGKKGLLWVAAKLGHLQLAERAIKGGASINRKDSGATSLDLALRLKHVEISKLLLEHGARPIHLLSRKKNKF